MTPTFVGRRITLMTMAVTVGGLFLFCPPVAASTLPQQPLAAELLSTDNLPTGWSVYPEDKSHHDSQLTLGGCLARATAWSTRHPAIGVGVQGSTLQGRSLFEEELATGGNASRHLQLLVAALDHCRDSSTHLLSIKVVVNAKPLSMRALGTSAHAFAVDFLEGQGSTTTHDRWDYVLFQNGTVYGSFGYHANPIRTRAFQMLATAAINKVHSHA